MPKIFSIADSGESITAQGMEHTLSKPDIAKVLGRFGYSVSRSEQDDSAAVEQAVPAADESDDLTVEVMPPIETRDLREVGRALVEMATDLDSRPPLPRYEITGSPAGPTTG